MKLPIVLLLAGALNAGAAWLRLDSTHFELYTDTGERSGRQALARLEQIRQVFGNTTTARSPVPVRVFLFASESDFLRFRTTGSTVGYFQGGPERNYIVMREAGTETYRVVFHEYVHLVMNHTSARRPAWLEEGIAEFYSTVEASGDRVRIGGIIPAHVATLMREKPLDAATLLGVAHDSPYYNEQGKAGVFYAQSWALVHMLNLAGGYRENLPRLAVLLEDGIPQDAALERAFGKSPAAIVRDLESYIHSGRFPTVSVAWEPPQAVEVEVKPLAPLHLELAQVDLLLHIGRMEPARRMLNRLSRRHPESAEVETALGFHEMSRREYTKARAHLERAIRLGSTEASTFFEYAVLLRDTGGGRDQVAANLRRAIELNAQYAEAHFLLGLMASEQGRHAEAVEPLEKAASLLPRQATFWHALAMAHHQAGRPEAARRAAAKTLAAAATESEKEMALALRKLTESRPAPASDSPRPAVRTPTGWQNRQGDTRLEGLLEQIDCLGAGARLLVASGGRRVALVVDKPSEVVLRNSTTVSFEFSCGPQKPRLVSVEYIATPLDTAAAGRVTAIEFR